MIKDRGNDFDNISINPELENKFKNPKIQEEVKQMIINSEIKDDTVSQLSHGSQRSMNKYKGKFIIECRMAPMMGPLLAPMMPITI